MKRQQDASDISREKAIDQQGEGYRNPAVAQQPAVIGGGLLLIYTLGD